MDSDSFSTKINRYTTFSTIITNFISFGIVFFLCATIITGFYKNKNISETQFISTVINEATETEKAYNLIASSNLKDEVELNHLLSHLVNRAAATDGLTIYFEKNDGNLSSNLKLSDYELYFKHLAMNNVDKNAIIHNGDLYIVDIRKFGDYIFFQSFNISDAGILKQFNQGNDLLGYKLNKKHIVFSNDNEKELDFSKDVELLIDSGRIDLIFSTRTQWYYYIFLFFTMLFLTIIRSFIVIFNTRKILDSVTKPFNKLIYSSEKLAAHEDTQKLNVSDYPYSELKQIAESLNKILLSRELSEIKLFRSFEQMESVVHKRTQELISTNEQLTAAIKKAEEGNALKSQFLANISHEIRTPLNCIMGFCDIILTEEQNSKVAEHVEPILHESETLLHLINDLLDYSKIDAGKMEIVKSELEIRSLINSLLKSGEIQVGDKNIELKSDIDSSIPDVILSDELRIYQVISNIFYNAIKFTPSGSVTIKVDRKKSDNHNMILVFSIIDTGIGIPEEKMDSIFNKFEQVDGSLTRNYRGSGLGLTICKTIIDLMKGDIEVTSDVNTGSCFKVTIPVGIKEQPELFDTETPVVAAMNVSYEGSSILLVEDYPVNQIVAKKHLEIENHRVITAENGKEALDRCSEEKFDLILMDLQMPVMDGFDATRNIRSNNGLNRRTPILAMTANAMDTARQSCLDTGMDGIITKPIRKAAFLKEINKWLKRSSQ